MSRIMANMLPETLHSDFSSSLFSPKGYVVFWDRKFFHFCQHNFMERAYRWDRFGRLIKSRSVGILFFFFSPPSSYFLLSSSSFFKHSLGPGFPLQPVFPLSHSFLPLPVLYSPMHSSIRYLLSRAGLLHNLAGSFSFHIIPQTHSIPPTPLFFCFSFYTEWGEAALFQGETQTQRRINPPVTQPLSSQNPPRF